MGVSGAASSQRLDIKENPMACLCGAFDVILVHHLVPFYLSVKCFIVNLHETDCFCVELPDRMKTEQRIESSVT